MRIADMKTSEQVLEEFLAKDAGTRERWERLEYARAVANRLIAYRAEHDLTQQQLAERVGVQQPHVARLESGEYAPSIPTLRRLARALGIEFHFDITPTDVRMSA